MKILERKQLKPVFSDLDPGGKRSHEDEVLEERSRSWEVQLLVRRESTIPES